MEQIKIYDCAKTLLPLHATIKDALNSLTQSGQLIVLVVDEDKKLMGIVTDSDIRRAIIKGKILEDPLRDFYNPNPKLVHGNDTLEKVKEILLTYKISRIPVLDDDRKPLGLYYLEDFIIKEHKEVARKDNRVIIMAGGKGTRLDPFTRILPKPLVPIGNKAVIEVIVDKFFESGFDNFILSVNYRREFIKTYFNELQPLPYKIVFVDEEKPLGTIGSLSLMKNLLLKTFIVANCDMILDIDWEDFLLFHKNKGNHITIVGALKNFKIPYGVITLDREEYKGIVEKPEYNFIINLGVYAMEPDVLPFIPMNEEFLATDLLEKTRAKGLKIGVYPIYNKWFDIGEWEEYKNTLKQLEE